MFLTYLLCKDKATSTAACDHNVTGYGGLSGAQYLLVTQLLKHLFYITLGLS